MPFVKGNRFWLGKKRSKDTIAKIIKTKTGVALSEEHKKAISMGNKGLIKKDIVSYSGIHKWVVANYQNPLHCEDCGIEGKYVGSKLIKWNIQWANISRKYERKREDWKGLCVKCHKLFDKKYKLYG